MPTFIGTISTVELRNSGMLCTQILSALAGFSAILQVPVPTSKNTPKNTLKNHNVKIFFQFTSLCRFVTDFSYRRLKHNLWRMYVSNGLVLFSQRQVFPMPIYLQSFYARAEHSFCVLSFGFCILSFVSTLIKLSTERLFQRYFLRYLEVCWA